MLVPFTSLLGSAGEGGYALGAFNVYNLEGVRAVVAASEAKSSPVIIQFHHAALTHGGGPLIAACLAAAGEASVPIAVHLDHSVSLDDIRLALHAGLTSIMADGSSLEYDDNVAFTQEATELAHRCGSAVEGELGRLTGSEDDLTVPENLAKLTDPGQAVDFVSRTGVDALAVCIGNAHGSYRTEPRLDFDRLAAIREVVSVPLVLHGASGLLDTVVRRAIELGVRKLNVNTELRQAYVGALKKALGQPEQVDLLEIMQRAVADMQGVVSAKLRLFGSTSKATK